MPTRVLFNRTFDARPDRIDFRDLQYRPRLVSLPDLHPSPDLIESYFPRYSAADLVLNQGKEGSCTGFGLAAVLNYLRWERWMIDQRDVRKKSRSDAPDRVSPRMLYQNARLYDEWRGDDYEGSSCRGAMKGLHKHGVCIESLWPYMDDDEPGRARPGWDENAPLCPLGAYFRIDGKSLVEMQSAIFETHAIYVSADVHDGWDRIEKCKSLEDAVIEPPPPKKDVGGHAFAIVGYTSDGFIIQNSWGPDWGYQGFALLPYEDWTRNGNDAWALALGAPMRVTLDGEKGKKTRRKFVSPSARTEISLDERLRIRGALRADVAKDTSDVPPWIEGDEADHIIFIGHNGYADRELVAANSRNDAVRIVIEKAVSAAAKGFSDLAIYCHGGLNNRTDGVKRAQILGPWLMANGIWPVFVVWQTGFRESANDLIKIGLERLGLPTETVEGWVVDKVKEGRDRAFEVFARDVGVRAIWENMKSRAAGSILKKGDLKGGLAVAADSLRAALDAQKPNKRPNIHLMGHSAGAIMQGHFLSVLAPLSIGTIHLWAPACTVPFATATYGAAFTNGVADPKKTFVGVLGDVNEKSDPCVPALYSKSLLYLVSRALETDHKTPILGLEKAWLNGKDDDTFMDGYKQQLKEWHSVSKGVKLDDPITKTEVPIRREKDKDETIDANHGSFDNNVDVVNQAITRITGEKPSKPVTDLRGF